MAAVCDIQNHFRTDETRRTGTVSWLGSYESRIIERSVELFAGVLPEFRLKLREQQMDEVS